MKQTNKTAHNTDIETGDAQHVDALFSFIRDAEVPTPSKQEFEAMLSRITDTPVVSPYTPLIRAFATLRFVTPLALGLLIVISGIGIETGRISFEASTKESTGTTSVAMSDVATSTFSERTLEQKSPVTISLADEVVAQETNYDTYFVAEDEAFTGLTDIYEVTL